MDKGRTRTFKGTFKSSDNKVNHVNVRVFKRLATFALSIALIRGVSPALSQIDDRIDENTKKIFKEGLADDEELVERIIQEKFNTLKSEDDRNDLDSLEESIATLESYFYDYVFNSSVGEIAKGEQAQSFHYKTIIYGTPKSEADVDPNSIFGRYIGAYLSFHEGRETHTEDESKAYITVLKDLAKDCEDEINLNGAIKVVIPYSEFASYIKAGSVKKNIASNAVETFSLDGTAQMDGRRLS